ncbi:hypothetical protein ACPTI2_11125 [Enterococcus faecalis]|uniref:hypothetical protein n=1 Tax=Enterococcus faecalis TaxID=1351 RepID=UPI003CC699D0
MTIINFMIAVQLSKLISNPENGYFQTVFVPMITLGLGKGLILTPVTTAGVYYEIPDELAGIASSITNTMH